MPGPNLLQRLQTLTQLASAQQSEVEARTKLLEGGATYIGEYRDGPGRIPHGQGELWRPGGRIHYDGEWKDGLMHGKGTYYFEDGTKWEGFFCDNELHGLGVWTPPEVERTTVQEGNQIIDEEAHQAKLKLKQKLRRKAKQSRPQAEPQRLAHCASDEQDTKSTAPSTTKREPVDGPKEVYFWHGKRVCSIDELENARVRVRLAKTARCGTIVDIRRRRGERARPQHLIRFDDNPEATEWVDLALYCFQPLRSQGKHYSVYSAT